jgi:pimeloyl-ACP methyl ester carboxylesterase
VEFEPKLVDVRVPKHPQAVVLVLHGGGSRTGGVAVSPTQLSVLRMIPIAHRVARADRGKLAVLRLINAVRGWDTEHTPVTDVAWAVDRIGERFGDLPVGLVGHSLGGRAALLSASLPAVRSVVALAPWTFAEDGRVDASGVRMLFVHGTRDRIASPERSAAAAALVRSSAESVSFVRVEDGKHAMLSRHGVFSSLAADFTVAALLPQGRVSDRTAGLLAGDPEPISL